MKSEASWKEIVALAILLIFLGSKCHSTPSMYYDVESLMKYGGKIDIQNYELKPISVKLTVCCVQDFGEIVYLVNRKGSNKTLCKIEQSWPKFQMDRVWIASEFKNMAMVCFKRLSLDEQLQYNGHTYELDEFRGVYFSIGDLFKD